MRFETSILSTLLPALASAAQIPGYSGMNVVFSDDFSGAAGAPVNSEIWNVVDNKMNVNNELETYSASNTNLQLSGGSTLQLVPWKGPSGWTSARIEQKGTVTPAAGKVTRVEASLRMGDAANKQGIWPAFWMLGDAVRHGTQWPTCGELDILEQRNGNPTAFGTAHCGVASGGICNEPQGKAGTTTVDNDFHTWTLTWDRTPATWQQEVITWYRDGAVFNTLSGAAIGDQATWATLAHSPFYIIFNVAVGGDFPGAPNDATQDGYVSMMEVEYVAVYST